MLLIAADEDNPYAEHAVALDAAGPTTQLLILEGRGHGTNMFDNHADDLNAALLNFLAARSG